MNTKLSIITINRNNKDGLQKTIESVINQTFKDYEYIVIDGASTDGSVDVIKQYANQITYWVSEPDKGIYNAMNKGILQTKGEYCLFLNSGDYLFDSNVLSSFFEQKPQEDIAFGNILGDTINYPTNLRFSFMYGLTIQHSASFIKRKLFDRIGLYDESYKIVSDWCFFMLALYKYDSSYKYYPIVISVFDTTGISSQPQSRTLLLDERDNFYKQEFPLFYEDYQEYFTMKQKLNRSKKDILIFWLSTIKKKIWKKKL